MRRNQSSDIIQAPPFFLNYFSCSATSKSSLAQYPMCCGKYFTSKFFKINKLVILEATGLPVILDSIYVYFRPGAPFCSGYGYCPHYNAESDHRKRRLSKTPSRVERFENDGFWKRCFLVWTEKNDAIWKRWRHQNRHDRTPHHSTMSIKNGGHTLPCGFSLDRNDFQSFDALASAMNPAEAPLRFHKKETRYCKADLASFGKNEDKTTLSNAASCFRFWLLSSCSWHRLEGKYQKF